MVLSYLTPENIHHFISNAFKEDIGDGDHTTLASIPENMQKTARLLIKENGILAGVEMAIHIFKNYDPDLQIHIFLTDGSMIEQGDVGFVVKGKARSILTSERLILNCLQRMSGIATYTHHLNSLIAHTHAKLSDTRKTTPNFRICEKWAVHIGGATNHRYGLYDMVLLKDNHIDFSGGIEQAIYQTHTYLKTHKKKLKIVIETRNIAEVEKVLRLGGVDRILLDNLNYDDLKIAIQRIDNKFETEVSGNITENNIVKIAECGVDFISVGALTHSAKSLDMSLNAI